MQKQNSISDNCSCLQCDSLSCFEKRRHHQHCSCDNCIQSTCRYYTGQTHYNKGCPAIYLNATPRKPINRFEELNEQNIDLESERKKILETNQPPRTLDEYLDRLLLCAKTSSKLKEQPSSLNKYIEMISENSEYKKKLNLLKKYVQKFKDANPPDVSENLMSLENFKNSICYKELCNQNLQLSEKYRKRSKCRGKCKSRQAQRNLNLTQAQSALVSCLQEHCQGPKRYGSQTNSVTNEQNNDTVSFRTSALCTPKENGTFKCDIVKKNNEAYKVCICKVCQCLPSKLNKDDECQCKPCQCSECVGYIVTPKASKTCNLPSDRPCCTNRHCNRNKLLALKERKKCLYVPKPCGICRDNCSTVHRNQSQTQTSCGPSVVKKHTEVTCTCLPCECTDCSDRYTGRVFSERQFYNSNNQAASVNEIYRHSKVNNRNMKQNIVAMYAGVPKLNANIGFASTRSKSCFDKECECLKCVCKEDTINSIKSSRFFSYDKQIEVGKCVMERSPVLMKLNNSHINSNPPKIKTERVHQRSSDLFSHSPCCACDECVRLERKVPLNRCQCSSCKCERCYAHKNPTSYSKTGVSLLKCGEVTPSHQTKVQKLNNISTSNKYRSHSYIKPQYEDDGWHTTSKNLKHQPSISRQAKRDIGTMHTRSLSKGRVLQCDAYVQGQEWKFTNPVLKNNFTNMTPGSYFSLDSMTRTQSIENDASVFENPDYYLSFSKQEIKSLEDALQIDSNSFTISSILKNNKPETQNNYDNIFANSTTKHDPIITHEGFDGTNSYRQQESKTNLKRNEICDASQTLTKIDRKAKNSIESLYVAFGLPNLCRNKCLSDSLLPSLEKFNNEEEKNKNSPNARDNFNCFRMIQNYNKPAFLNNVHNRYKLANGKFPDYTTNDASDIDEDYKRVQKTLADAKAFTMYLLSLLELYEKANNEFEKVSEKLKLSYDALFGDKVTSDQEKCDTTLESVIIKIEPVPLKETNISDLKQNIISRESELACSNKLNLPNTELEEKLNIIIHEGENDLNQNKVPDSVDDDKIPSEQSNVISKYTPTVEHDITFPTHENDAVPENEQGQNVNLEVVNHDKIQNEQNNVKPTCSSSMEYDSIIPTHENDAVAEISCYENVKQVPDNEKPAENIELINQLSRTTSTEINNVSTTTSVDSFKINPKVEKEVETNDLTESQYSFNCTPETYNPNKGDSSIIGYTYEVGTKVLSVSLNEPKSPTTVIQEAVSRHGNKALSLLKLDVNAQGPSKQKPSVQPSLYVNKEVWCDGQKFLNEFKKQIREELQVACAHPLMNKGSTPGSYSSNGEFEDQKARFLVVRKVSEHTALVRWNEPRDLMGVKGYELQVDGRTIQKIFNPSKCITAVTCLPHTDKILLTIRTITLAKSETGRYPSTTIVYRPRLQ